VAATKRFDEVFSEHEFHALVSELQTQVRRLRWVAWRKPCAWLQQCMTQAASRHRAGGAEGWCAKCRKATVQIFAGCCANF